MHRRRGTLPNTRTESGREEIEIPGKLDGKVVIITGAGRGIGRGVARGCAREGAKVVVADYGADWDGKSNPSHGPADSVVSEIRSADGEAVAAYEDVGTMQGGKNIVEKALAEFGRVDGVANFAGIAVQKDLWEFTEDDWDTVLNVHLKGHFSLTRAVIPHMMKQGSGSLIFISSSASVSGPPQAASYAAAKAGILGFTWSAAKSLMDHGIRVNCIMPGGHTRLVDNLSGTWGLKLPEGLDTSKLVRRTSDDPAIAGTPGDPANVAPGTIYLLSDASTKVTGQVFAHSGYQMTLFDQPQPVRTIRADGPWDIDDLFRQFPETFGEELIIQPLDWGIQG